MQAYTVRVGKRGQITLPQVVRQQLAVNAGDILTLVQLSDLLLIEPPQLPQLSQRFSQQMDDAGLTLQDLLEGLAQERQISSKIHFGQEA